MYKKYRNTGIVQFTLEHQASNTTTMCHIKNIDLRQDEDHLAIKKKKARTLKPRDKWSLLRFIPSQALNSREEGSTGVKKGKRLGFDRFNQLSFKVCRKAFHKFLFTWALLEAGDSIMRNSRFNERSKIIESIIGR